MNGFSIITSLSTIVSMVTESATASTLGDGWEWGRIAIDLTLGALFS